MTECSPAGSLRLRAAFALVLLCAPHLISRAEAQARAATVPEKARPTEQKDTIAIAARIVAAAPRLAGIWPDFWPADQPFIIYLPNRGALLISTGAPPPSFEPLPGSELPGQLKGLAFWHSGSLPDVKRPFVTGYPIGQGKTAVLVDGGKSSAEAITSLLLHEQFHDHQKRAFKGRVVPQFVDPLAIKDRVGFAASAEIERRMLAKAVAAEDARERRRLLRQYFALRQEREAAMPPQVIQVERGFELVEGTAEYAERAGHAAIAGDGAGLQSLLIARLEKPLASEAGAFATIWFRSRSYGTGAAITYLIGRLDPGNWRAKLAGGTMPDELLASLVGRPTSAEAPALARGARAAFRHTAVLRELEPAIRAGERAEIKSVEEFLARAPHRLVLEAKAAADGSTGFDARGMAQLGPATIALPSATMFNHSAASVSLSAQNLPVLMEGHRYTLLLPSAPEIVGLSGAVPGEYRLDSAHIRSSGIQLRIDRPVVVTVAERATTITIVDR